MDIKQLCKKRNDFLDFIKSIKSKSTMINYVKVTKSFISYVKDKVVDVNEESIQSFIDLHHSYKYIIRIFYDYYQNLPLNDHILKHKEHLRLYGGLLDAYVADCKNKGNKDSTIKLKERFIFDFLLFIESQDIDSLENLSIKEINTYLSSVDNIEAYSDIRNFLKFLFCKEILSKNLSIHIVKPTRRKPFPSVYTKDEIENLKSAIKYQPNVKERNLAVFLLASKLGMRTSDILNLKKRNIDYNEKEIEFVQIKTNSKQKLPLLPEIEMALNDYYSRKRGQINDDDYIFMNNSNTLRMSSGACRHMLNQLFSITGIETKGRKHGMHSLRSSLASELINNDFSYEITRKILGHKSTSVIKHYVKIDIERLRNYALEPKPVSGRIKEMFGGARHGI